MITLEIPKSDWNLINEKLVRTGTILKEQQHESVERHERIVNRDAQR